MRKLFSCEILYSLLRLSKVGTLSKLLTYEIYIIQDNKIGQKIGKTCGKLSI